MKSDGDEEEDEEEDAGNVVLVPGDCEERLSFAAGSRSIQARIQKAGCRGNHVLGTGAGSGGDPLHLEVEMVFGAAAAADVSRRDECYADVVPVEDEQVVVEVRMSGAVAYAALTAVTWSREGSSRGRGCTGSCERCRSGATIPPP